MRLLRPLPAIRHARGDADDRPRLGRHDGGAREPDLARYDKQAVWRGVYYRGEKIGFTVKRTVPSGYGFEIQEDGRLEMRLLGADSEAAIRTTARAVPLFVLTEGLTILANESLGVDPVLKVVTAATIVFMSLALVGLAIGVAPATLTSARWPLEPPAPTAALP